MKHLHTAMTVAMMVLLLRSGARVESVIFRGPVSGSLDSSDPRDLFVFYWLGFMARYCKTH